MRLWTISYKYWYGSVIWINVALFNKVNTCILVVTLVITVTVVLTLTCDIAAYSATSTESLSGCCNYSNLTPTCYHV